MFKLFYWRHYCRYAQYFLTLKAAVRASEFGADYCEFATECIVTPDGTRLSPNDIEAEADRLAEEEATRRVSSPPRAESEDTRYETLDGETWEVIESIVY